jgi:hypothetical protein
VRWLLVSLLAASLELSLAPESAQTKTPLSARMQRAANFYRTGTAFRDGFMGVVAAQKGHRLIYEGGYEPL